jgi:hypothetical protein
MSTTQMGTAQTGRTDARREDDVRRGFVAGSTEARPGIMTTEFWLSIAMATAVIVAGYFSDALNVDTAWALGAGVIAAYAVSRGLAKAGSREGPFIISSNDRDSGR